jgi:hypothetical protein
VLEENQVPSLCEVDLFAKYKSTLQTAKNYVELRQEKRFIVVKKPEGLEVPDIWQEIILHSNISAQLWCHVMATVEVREARGSFLAGWIRYFLSVVDSPVQLLRC